MTHQEKLAFIRERAIAANPEIVELKFGCEVKNWLKGTALILKVHKYQGESDCYDVAYYKLPEIIVERTPFNNWKIIGRKIGLVDIIVTLQKFGKFKENHYLDVSYGFIRIIEVQEDETDTIVSETQYNFLKDDITLQSEDTVSFIYNLLK